jgi:hypothetical protein
MNLQELYTYCREVIEKYPELRDEVMQHFALAEMESEDDCSSEEHECELSYTDIDALLEQFETQEEKDIKNGLYGEE